MEILRERPRLLYVCHQFNNFQKDQIESLRPYYYKANCLVRENPLFRYGSYLPIGSLTNYRHGYAFDYSNVPDGVSVYPTNVFYIPHEKYNQMLGSKIFRISDKCIMKNNIEFDLIHAHFLWTSGEVGKNLKIKYNKPLIATAHGFDIYSLPFKNESWRFRIKQIIESCSHLITVSKKNYECVKKLDVDTPTSVIPNGFNPQIFHPQDRSECRRLLKLNQDETILLSVGNLDSVKGHRFLLESLCNIEDHECRCIIIGSGPLGAQLKKYARTLGVSDMVVFIGSQAHHLIPIWMNAADLFVLPSLNEGNPTVMFEALGCGLPFVGTSVGGVPDVIDDNSGILCPPNDSDALGGAITSAMNKRWNRKFIADSSTKYTWNTVAKQIADVYEKVME